MKLRLDGRACWCWALMLLILPLKWLTAAFLAACFHELCHFAAVKLCGGEVLSVTVGATGAEMEVYDLGNRGECISALAGPAGSILLLILAPVFPTVAVCALVQGLYNLLPIWPLDGGRAVRCLLAQLCPRHGAQIAAGIEAAVMTAIFLLFVIFWRGMLVLPGLMLIHRIILRKRPCK